MRGFVWLRLYWTAPVDLPNEWTAMLKLCGFSCSNYYNKVKLALSDGDVFIVSGKNTQASMLL